MGARGIKTKLCRARERGGIWRAWASLVKTPEGRRNRGGKAKLCSARGKCLGLQRSVLFREVVQSKQAFVGATLFCKNKR